MRDALVVPGLVDAHAHLQIAPLGSAAPRKFLPWVRAVMAARTVATPADVDAATRYGLRSRRSGGASAIGEIDSTGRSARVARAWPDIAVRCFRELTGFHVTDRGSANTVVREAAAGVRRGVRFGLSPHAPYSASAELLYAAATKRWTQVHVAEVPEEVQLLRDGTGPFRALLESLGRWPAGWRAPGVSPVAYLHRLGLLSNRKVSLVHCQELDDDDLDILAASAVVVVVCPGTVSWFRRSPPRVPELLGRGVRVALGSDSSASNDDVSMLAAMAGARRLWPSLSAETVLAMATSAGARALGLPNHGTLEPGTPVPSILRLELDGLGQASSRPLELLTSAGTELQSRLRWSSALETFTGRP